MKFFILHGRVFVMYMVIGFVEYRFNAKRIESEKTSTEYVYVSIPFASVLPSINMQKISPSELSIEPPRGKTNNVHRRKQRLRSASQ